MTAKIIDINDLRIKYNKIKKRKEFMKELGKYIDDITCEDFIRKYGKFVYYHVNKHWQVKIKEYLESGRWINK